MRIFIGLEVTRFLRRVYEWHRCYTQMMKAFVKLLGLCWDISLYFIHYVSEKSVKADCFAERQLETTWINDFIFSNIAQFMWFEVFALSSCERKENKKYVSLRLWKRKCSALNKEFSSEAVFIIEWLPELRIQSFYCKDIVQCHATIIGGFLLSRAFPCQMSIGKFYC